MAKGHVRKGTVSGGTTKVTPSQHGHIATQAPKSASKPGK